MCRITAGFIKRLRIDKRAHESRIADYLYVYTSKTKNRTKTVRRAKPSQGNQAPSVVHWTRVNQSTRCWCMHCDISGGDFCLSGELGESGSSPQLKLTAQRESMRRKQVGSVIDDTSGLDRGPECTVPCCVSRAGRRIAADTTAYRASNVVPGQWLGSDQTEPSQP